MGKIFIIDPGHGGMLSGSYLTDLKTGKFFRHHDGTVAYEGETNRLIANMVIKQMTDRGIKCINLCPTEIDIPLSIRADIANLYSQEYGIDNVLGISIHSNAGGGRGFEVWTSPGQNKSDVYASIFYDKFIKTFPRIVGRTDETDGDSDKESLFYILKNTVSPWILPEFLFFDNFIDWQLLKDTSVQLKYATMIAEFAVSINK
jgi:N-acetylmuramoyl-L-alanine amidase